MHNLTNLAAQLTDSRAKISSNHSTIRGSMKIDENCEVLGPFTEEEFLEQFLGETSGQEEKETQQTNSG